MATSKGNPSKRTTTTTNHADHSTRASKAKPDSGSEEVHTAPLTNESVQITRKHRTRHADQIYEDADEESAAIRAIMTKSRAPTAPSNNSAVRLQQQGMGDHYHLHPKQHRSRTKSTGRSHQELDERDLYRWRLFMCLLTIVLLAFVISRFLLAMWPKPRKSLVEEWIDDLLNLFTP